MVLVLCTSSNTCMKFQDVFNSFHVTHIHHDSVIEAKKKKKKKKTQSIVIVIVVAICTSSYGA